jgi:hypothetical protein
MLLANGGTPVYNYAFSNGTQNQTGDATSLKANTYSVTITDAMGCSMAYTTNGGRACCCWSCCYIGVAGGSNVGRFKSLWKLHQITAMPYINGHLQRA